MLAAIRHRSKGTVGDAVAEMSSRCRRVIDILPHGVEEENKLRCVVPATFIDVISCIRDYLYRFILYQSKMTLTGRECTQPTATLSTLDTVWKASRLKPEDPNTRIDVLAHNRHPPASSIASCWNNNNDNNNTDVNSNWKSSSNINNLRTFRYL